MKTLAERATVLRGGLMPELKPCPLGCGERLSDSDSLNAGWLRHPWPHPVKRCPLDGVAGPPELWNRRMPDLTEALARLKALEEEMRDEKVDVIEIWQRDKGIMVKEYAAAEIRTNRAKWADEIAAIRKALGASE